MAAWPTTTEELVAVQLELAEERPELWHPGARAPAVGGCFACFAADDPGAGADTAWAGAALLAPGEATQTVAVVGAANGAYRPGLLALRAGPALEQAVRQLPALPEVLLVDATGRDHPRGAGLALHLGRTLGVPTIGVTNRTLVAQGEWPPAERGASTPLRTAGETVGAWLRIQPTARPIAVHAAWRTDAETAVAVVMAVARKVRTPEALRQARRVARLARAEALAATG